MAKKNLKDKNFNQDENVQRGHHNGKDWIGNIINRGPVYTKEEIEEKTRSSVRPEWLPLYDSNSSSCFRFILHENSVIKDFKGFILSLGSFEDLTEKDFSDLKKISDVLYIRFCDPAKLVFSIFYKKEIEHYNISFNFPENSKEAMVDVMYRKKQYVGEYIILTMI